MTSSRPFDPADDERVVALYARVHEDDETIDALDLARFRAFRSIPAFADGRAFRVVEKNDAIVALLTVGKMNDPRAGGDVWRTRAFVDPSVRQRGIATALFAQCERDARIASARALEAFVLGAWTAGRAFATKLGFEVYVHDLFLSRSLDAFDAAVPREITLRAWKASDAAIVASLANATLARDIGFVPETPEFVASASHHEGFAIWIAEEKNAAVGFCHVDVRGRVGYVQAVGVLASHEGRGVGAALVARAIETLRTRDVDRIELCTEENNTRAQRLYARAGFTRHRDAFTLRKRLT
jgi:mycothiol synthase